MEVPFTSVGEGVDEAFGGSFTAPYACINYHKLSLTITPVKWQGGNIILQEKGDGLPMVAGNKNLILHPRERGLDIEIVIIRVLR
jgi:hypothetical protein